MRNAPVSRLPTICGTETIRAPVIVSRRCERSMVLSSSEKCSGTRVSDCSIACIVNQTGRARCERFSAPRLSSISYARAQFSN